jgi:hypothetical protein
MYYASNDLKNLAKEAIQAKIVGSHFWNGQYRGFVKKAPDSCEENNTG